MPILPPDQTADALALFGVQAGPRSGEEIAVRAPVLTLGQGSQSDIVLADDSVSTTHARLEYSAGVWLLTDLASTNGTYLEGARLPPNTPTPLAYGSQVRFGGLGLLFREVPAADLEAARAGYAPPGAAVPIAARGGGLRVPVWVFLLLVLIFAAIAFFAVGASGQARLEAAAPLTGLAPISRGFP